MSKIIIIGAPRSGTNMLRDVLTSFSKIGTWPCDEINYIWRHGNVRYHSDEIPAAMARPQIIKFINKHFDLIRQKESLDYVVEKTCANSLRVPFVNAILPDAKYIYIYRDGIDVIGSANIRWHANLEFKYLLKKTKYVPTTDLPYYLCRYIYNRMYKILSKDKRQAFWGPDLDDMQSILDRYSLYEVCALQWAKCVSKAETALSNFSNDKVFKLKYEEFVTNPDRELKKIFSFMGYSTNNCNILKAVANVSTFSIGKGRAMFSNIELNNLEALIRDPLKRYKYI